MADNASQAYPARLAVEYPDGPRNRLTVFVRILLAIPILIIGALVTGSTQVGQTDQVWNFGRTEALVGAIGLFLATALMILCRQQYALVVRLEPGETHALGAPRHRLRVPADDGPLSAVPAGRVGSPMI